MFYLESPSDEDDVEYYKDNGALFDLKTGQWYVTKDILESVNDCDFIGRLKMRKELSLLKPIYIVTAFRACWKCNRVTKVYALGCHRAQLGHPGCLANPFDALNENYPFDARSKINNGMLLFYGYQQVDKITYAVLRKHVPKYFYDYSKFMNQKYWMNHCEHCSMKQGDFDTFDEFDSAFRPIHEDGFNKIIFNQLDLIRSTILGGVSLLDFWETQEEFSLSTTRILDFR